METKDSLDKFSRSQNNENIGIELLYNSKSLDGVEIMPTQDVNDYNMLCNELEVNP